MSGFKVEKQTASAIVLDDLGITLVGATNSIHDLTSKSPEEIARSADLLAAIPADLLVVDPRDDTNATILSSADSTAAISRHNDTHFGISEGRFGPLDDPTTAITDNFIVQYDSGGDTYESINPANLISDQGDAIALVVSGMGTDGADSTFVFDGTATILVESQDETRYDAATNNGTFTGGDGVGGTAYVAADTITLSDGSIITVDVVDGNGDVTDFTVTTSGGTNVTAGVTLTQSSTSGTGTDFDLTPEQNNISNGTIQWDVDDSFLRNTGDTLDSGTLTIASGATVAFASGSNLTIDAAVTTATIGTPGGGFTGDTDIVNKLYVDSVANGLDWKDSVRACTDTGEDLTGAPYNGTYSAVGGTAGTGEFTGVDLTNAVDGITLGLDDRLLVKNQGTGTQNGIYIVTTAGAAGVLERAADSDTDADVTAGNATFVEEGTVCADTAWVITTDDPITLNTTAIVWTQFAGPGALTAGIGLSRASTVIDLDVDDLATATPVFTDSIAFHDVSGTPESSGSITRKATFEDVVNALDVPHDITANGLVTRTAADTYTSRSIAVDGAGPLDGLVVANGDGVSGNPTVGLDIQNLPATAGVDAALDRVAVWDSSANANVYYTVTQIATATSANSFETWLGAGNTSGDASIVADSATDTANVTGGIGINIDLTAASDTITYSFTRLGMADTAVVSGDTIPFFDTSNANEPEFRSFANVLSDLGVTTGTFYQSIAGGDGGVTATAIGADTITVNGTGINVTTTNGGAGLDTLDLVLDISDLTAGTTLVLADEIAVNDGGTTVRYTFTDLVEDLDIPNAITANGFVVRTAADTYASRTLDASVDEDELGITITDGDGVAGDPQIGLDIVGLSDPDADMATTDEFAVHDKSEGTAGANRKMTGQNIADGVETILGLTSLTFTDINGQSILTHIDTSRSSKVLSIDSHPYMFANNTLDDAEWMDLGDASNTDVGITMPLDGTIVMATGQTEDDNGNTFQMDVYIDGVDSGSVGTLTGGANSEFQSTTLDLDFTQGQKLRVRGDRSAGSGELGDVNVVIIVRWRDIP